MEKEICGKAVEALNRKREQNHQMEKVGGGLDPKNDDKVLHLLAESEQPRKRRRSVLYDGLEESSENVESSKIKEDTDKKKFSPWSRIEQQAIINFLQTHGGFSLRKTDKLWEKLGEMQICPGRSAMACRNQFNRYLLPRLPDFGVSAESL